MDNLILVSGARGMLGTTLIEACRNKGIRAEALEADVGDFGQVKAAVAAHPPAKWIVHAAAIISAKQCEEDRMAAFRSNVIGTMNACRAAQEVGARLLYISTVSVFSCEEGDYQENDLPYPKNYYSLTKYLGEFALNGYPEARIVRLSLLGSHPGGSRGRNFFEWLIDSCRQNADLRLYNDVFMNPLSPGTAADFLIRLMEGNFTDRVLHLGSRDIKSKADIGRQVVEAFPGYSGKFEELSESETADSLCRPKQMWLNTNRASELMGPMPELEDEINLCLKEVLG